MTGWQVSRVNQDWSCQLPHLSVTPRENLAHCEAIVGVSANVLVRLLQCVSNAPPQGAPGQCAIPGSRWTVDRLLLPRDRLHRPFRGKFREKRCVRPSPRGVGYLSSNLGWNRAYRAGNAPQLRHSNLKAVSSILPRALQRHETGISPTLPFQRGSAGLLISFSRSSGCQRIWRSSLRSASQGHFFRWLNPLSVRLPYLTDCDADSNSSHPRQVSMLLIG